MGLKAEQINFGMVVGDEPSVTNAEFNALGALRLDPAHDTLLVLPNWNLTGGSVQYQLDKKQNSNVNLDDLADGELTWNLVDYGEFFIKEEGADEMVWTWVDRPEYTGGEWKMPPGAQRLNDLMDASTMPLAGEESSDNVFIGERSGFNIGNGNLNTALGKNALTALEDGDVNIAIGKDAGQLF